MNKQKTVLVSMCLLGIPCRWNGKVTSKLLDLSLIKKYSLLLVPICPEQLSGLSTPRLPAEIFGGDGFDVLNGKAKVLNVENRDVTDFFIKGACLTAKIASTLKATAMITKNHSPSCSCKSIYDGTFTNKLKKGIGVTAAYLISRLKLTIIDTDDLNKETIGKLYENL